MSHTSRKRRIVVLGHSATVFGVALILLATGSHVASVAQSPEDRANRRGHASKRPFKVQPVRSSRAGEQGVGHVSGKRYRASPVSRDPKGTTYGVSHLVGVDLPPAGGGISCFLIFDPSLPGAPDDVVVYDGSPEAIRTDLLGTVPTVTETITDNGDGTVTLTIDTSSPPGTELYPLGFVDPATQTVLKDACFNIGLDDPLDWPGADSVLSAVLTFSSDGATVAGPFSLPLDVFFTDPWNGLLGVAILDLNGSGVNGVELELVVEKKGGTPTSGCCRGASCSVETASGCGDLGGTYLGNGTDCTDNPCDDLRIDELIPPSGSVGMPVVIVGQGFSPSTSANTVRFNAGVQASLLNPSTSNIIMATVPAGATTGSVDVTVAAETVTSAKTFTVVPDPGLTNLLEVQSDAAFQPFQYSLLGSLAPTVRITLDPAITKVTSFSVLLVTGGLSEPTELAGKFTLAGTPLTATATINVPAAANTIVVAVNDSVSFSGTMVNYDPATAGFGAEMNPDRISATPDPDSSMPYQLDFLEIGFVTGTTDAEIRALLEAHSLVPVGIHRDLTESPSPISVITNTSASGLTPVQLRAAIKDQANVSYVALSLIPELEGAIGETLPARLINGGPYPTYTSGTSNVAYDAASGGFDHDATMSGGVPVDELDLNWRHFFMQTFAAHRLTSHMVGGGPPPGGAPALPILAIVDSGFGNGGANAGANPVLNDLPLGRLGRTDMDGRAFNAIDATGGVITSPTAASPALPEDRVAITGITDRVNPNGHGTFVALLAAGNGTIVQGMAPNVNVIPYRWATGADIREALRDIGTRPEIDVVNYSIAAGPWASVAAAAAGVAPIVPRLNTLRSNGQIFVSAAANTRVNTNLFTPQLLTDSRGAGAPAYPLTLNVAATDIPAVATSFGPIGPEETWRSTSATGGTAFGARVSVCAPGGQRYTAMTRAGVMRNTTGGTSWAAPLVSGLATELIFLDEWLNGAPAAGAARRAARLRIVDTIKGTADDLDSNSAGSPFVNNNAGNGADNNFGYGRINAWKATLAIINGGLSTQQGRPNAGNHPVFGSLPMINDDATQWYGFEIITSELGATAWLSEVTGTKLEDFGSSVPGGADITAYKGVRSHQRIERGVHNVSDGSSTDAGNAVVEEDPTSGVVAVGTRIDGRGQYVITFSIKREELYETKSNGDPNFNAPRTLSLRRRGKGVDDRPIFNLRLDTEEMQTGRVSGVSFDDFVFQIVPPDYGDASIPPTVMAAGNGARHENTNLEWLGKLGEPNLDSVTPEHNVRKEVVGGDPNVDVDGVVNRLDFFHDRDGRDDGVLFFPLTFKTADGNPGKLQFTIGVFDYLSTRYAADADHSLFINLWIDWSADGTWDETNKEHVLNGLQINPSGVGGTAWQIVNQGTSGSATVQTRSAIDSNSAEFESMIPVGNIGDGLMWARMRLDYGENVGRNNPAPQFVSLPSIRPAAGAPPGLAAGAARYGEVEDYLIGTDFGDAPDAGGAYPTLKASAGARHLDIHQEWLGPDNDVRMNATREVDANDPVAPPGTDEDPKMNLQPENTDSLCDGVVLPPIVPGALVFIPVTVTSSISARGAVKTSFAAAAGSNRTVSEPDDEADSLPRYDANDPKRRLYLAGWADWNGDAMWSSSEKIIDDIIDPEDFGPDFSYTLGEVFTDENKNGVYDDGEPFFDDFGKDTKTFIYPVQVPEDIADSFYFRFRLAYGEDEGKTIDIAIKENDEDGRSHNEEKGGALFAEVEDYPVTIERKIKIWDVVDSSLAVPGTMFDWGPGIWTQDGVPMAESFSESIYPGVVSTSEGPKYDYVKLPKYPNDWHWPVDFSWETRAVRVEVWFEQYTPVDLTEGSVSLEVPCSPQDYVPKDILIISIDVGQDSYFLSGEDMAPLHKGTWSAYPDDLPEGFVLTGAVRQFSEPDPLVGACCSVTKGCFNMLPADCKNAGGTHLGSNVFCVGDSDNSGLDDACELATCTTNGDCADGLVCTFDLCANGRCSNATARYGDVAGPGGICGPDGIVALEDILAILNGFQGTFAEGCSKNNIDIAGPGGSCTSDDDISLVDILVVLDAFQGLDNCCSSVTGACCTDGICTESTPSDCIGDYQGDGVICTVDLCPFEDCNLNGAPDAQDIADGTSSDCNENGIPDECEAQACCLPNGICTVTSANDCIASGGARLGPGTPCTADSCSLDEVCEDCGPGEHWIDSCAAGDDELLSAGLVGLDVTLDCKVDTNLILYGPAVITRCPSRDVSARFPNEAFADGHLDIIDTEMTSAILNTSDGLVTLTVGAGKGQGGVLKPTYGAIVEHKDDSLLGTSFFQVYFEISLGDGTYAYNVEPLRVEADITCVPPKTTYFHPTGCLALFSAPDGNGVHVANLVTAEHVTFPSCGDASGGDCFQPNGTPFCDAEACCLTVCDVLPQCCDLGWDESCVGAALELCQSSSEPCCLVNGSCTDATPAQCLDVLNGIPLGPDATCQGDENNNGVDDACETTLNGCCFFTEGCFPGPPEICKQKGGFPVPECLGDLNENGIDDACE